MVCFMGIFFWQITHAFILPHNDIKVIYTGAQRLVEQDSPIAHNDASFTAETAGQEG